MKQEYSKISTPIELLDFMKKNIKYGFIGNKTYTDSNDEEFQKACVKEWKLSSPEELLTTGYGHCWDQVELERDWFSKHNYEFKTIFIFFMFNHVNNYPTHTYLIYKDNNKWYYFEHSDASNVGIHGFNTYKEAIIYQMNKHIEFASINNEMNDEIKKHIKIYEYNHPVYGCNMLDYINSIINLTKDITNEIIDF